jgi:hypothetical protein
LVAGETGAAIPLDVEWRVPPSLALVAWLIRNQIRCVSGLFRIKS